MKKIVIAVLVAISLSSCSKSKKDHCYTCELRGVGGYYRVLDTCADVTSDQFRFRDPRNNDVSHLCTEK